MRVLLAGATGAIGRELVPQLIAAGHEVIGITRHAGALAGSGAQEIVADVLDREGFLRALDGVSADAVINQLTALAKPPVHYRDMRQTNRLRTEGTSTLIAAARQVGAKRFVTASIFYGYGFSDRGRVLLDESASFGSEPDKSPNDDVLRAVLSNEQQARAFGGVALRYGLFYSAHSRPSPVARRWDGALPVVHIADAAQAAVLALTKGKPGEAYNVATDEEVTYRELQDRLAALEGVRRPTEVPDGLLRAVAPFGSQLVTRASVRLSSEKARRVLGWRPRYERLDDLLPPAPARSPHVRLPSGPTREEAAATRAAAVRIADARAAQAREAQAREAYAHAAADRAAAAQASLENTVVADEPVRAEPEFVPMDSVEADTVASVEADAEGVDAVELESATDDIATVDAAPVDTAPAEDAEEFDEADDLGRKLADAAVARAKDASQRVAEVSVSLTRRARESVARLREQRAADAEQRRRALVEAAEAAEAAEAEAADRQAALNAEAAALQAAEQEETAVPDTAVQDSAGQDSAVQDSAEPDSEVQDSAEQDSAEPDSEVQDSAEREVFVTAASNRVAALAAVKAAQVASSPTADEDDPDSVETVYAEHQPTGDDLEAAEVHEAENERESPAEREPQPVVEITLSRAELTDLARAKIGSRRITLRQGPPLDVSKPIDISKAIDVPKSPGE